LNKELTKNNIKRLNDLERRMEGHPIGSGMVESAAKQFKDRFYGAGMRWSRKGAERVIPLRSAILSKRFDKRGAPCLQLTPILQRPH
jgi:hypothetical protein